MDSKHLITPTQMKILEGEEQRAREAETRRILEKARVLRSMMLQLDKKAALKFKKNPRDKELKRVNEIAMQRLRDGIAALTAEITSHGASPERLRWALAKVEVKINQKPVAGPATKSGAARGLKGSGVGALHVGSTLRDWG